MTSTAAHDSTPTAPTMRVLVAYASRHGATAGIARRIAEQLQAAGLDADVRDVQEVDDVAAYDAVVLGAAAYMFHWLKDATRFARRHRDVLAARPTWLFSSGPLGDDPGDDEGNDLLEVSRPKEFDELHELLHPRRRAGVLRRLGPRGAAGGPCGVVHPTPAGGPRRPARR